MSLDVETWWRRLGSAALVGTARRPAPSVADLGLASSGEHPDAPSGAHPAPRPGARPEEAALDAAALGGALRRAGRLPGSGTVVVPAAPPEPLPEAPPRARQLLDLLLTQPPTDATGTEALLIHWCATCREAGFRVPHRLLPALLTRATSTDLRGQAAATVGERGRWLAAQNPDWSWVEGGRTFQRTMDGLEAILRPYAGARDAAASAATGDHPRRSPAVDPDRWALLPTDERLRQLRGVREVDPDAGRELLLTTWSTDAARDRRALLEALTVGLGPADEDVLEGALDDRAASVRELAALLLDGLPDSRRAARMAERLRPLVSEAGLLRRHLEVRLPDEPDAAGRRDGLGRPPAGRSARGWWLERIVAGAPFDVWGDPPDRVVPRLAKEHEVLAGLRRAATARRTPDWAVALLELGVDPELLAVLPREEREARVIEQLARAPHTRVPALAQNLALPWSPQASAAVVGRLARLKPEETGVVLEALMPRLVRALHQDAVPALQRWRVQAALPRRHDDQLGSLIQSRTLRQTISEAFQ